jgi:single-strand selective monofunctional uracil DNA glycosylase
MLLSNGILVEFMDADLTELIRQAAIRLKNGCSGLIPILIKEQIKLDVIYNPLFYAWNPHNAYISRFSGNGAKILMMGMNPGHGMGNTGVPFGCPEQVKEFLKIQDLIVEQPKMNHPKRIVVGLEQPKAEVSGRRIWSLLKEIFDSPEKTSEHIYIVNHCPLWMFNEKGQNITPEKLTGKSADKLYELCDQHLRDVVEIMDIDVVIGIGNYAASRAKIALKDMDLLITKIPHPSPASPLANRDKGEYWKNIAKSEILNHM